MHGVTSWRREVTFTFASCTGVKEALTCVPTAVATDSFNDTVSLYVVTLRGTVNTFRGFSVQSVSRVDGSPLGNFIPGANQQLLACPTPDVSTNLYNFEVQY